MARPIIATAERIAKRLRTVDGFTNADFAWEHLRDLCDIATGGQWDALPLDLLTDHVSARLKEPTK